MAYINQYEADMARDRRNDQAIGEVMSGLRAGIQGFTENRQRALQQRRQEAQDSQNKLNFEMNLAANGASAEDIENYRKTGDTSSIFDKYSKIAQSKRDSEKARLDLDTEAKRAQIEADRAKTAEYGKSFQDSREGKKLAYQMDLERQKRASEPTVFQKKLDERVATDIAEFETGGSVKQQENLMNLDEAISKLESSDMISGPVVGRIPEWMRKTVGADSVKVKQQIHGAVQSSLRETLGAQFTEKEGERILNNAFDESLDERENARRAKLIRTGIQSALDVKRAIADHMRAGGSMANYNGPTPESAFMGIVKSDPSLTKGTRYDNGQQPQQQPFRQALPQAIQATDPAQEQKLKRLQELRAKAGIR